jgi:alkylhydroperoxidase family enzyme
LQGEQFHAAARALRAGDLDAAPVSDAERLLLEFVGTVTRHAYRVTDEQVQALRDAGWTDAQVAEAVYVAALFSLFVRLADAFDIHPPALYEPEGPPAAAIHPPASTRED